MHDFDSNQNPGNYPELNNEYRQNEYCVANNTNIGKSNLDISGKFMLCKTAGVPLRAVDSGFK
jgi:hypothetical protein